MDICPLCGQTATLIDSHYLPAAFSRRLHDVDENGKILHPILLDEKRAMSNCKQTKTKLLCKACEYRFKVQGEKWVIRYTPKMGTSLYAICLLKALLFVSSAPHDGPIFTLEIKYRGFATPKLFTLPRVSFGGDGPLTGLGFRFLPT